MLFGLPTHHCIPGAQVNWDTKLFIEADDHSFAVHRRETRFAARNNLRLAGFENGKTASFALV
jgi:hypothetical protein